MGFLLTNIRPGGDVLLFSLHGKNYSLKKSWRQWNVLYFTYNDKTKEFGIRRLNSIQRILRRAFRFYAPTHAKNLQKGLTHYNISWDAKTRRSLIPLCTTNSPSPSTPTEPEPGTPIKRHPPILPWCQQLAASGNQAAHLKLGRMHEEGDEVPVDLTAAENCYQTVIANDRHLQYEAYVRLGDLYLKKAKGNEKKEDRLFFLKKAFFSYQQTEAHPPSNKKFIETFLNIVSEESDNSIKKTHFRDVFAKTFETLFRHFIETGSLPEDDVVYHLLTWAKDLPDDFPKKRLSLVFFMLLLLWKGGDQSRAKTLLESLHSRQDAIAAGFPSMDALTKENFLETPFFEDHLKKGNSNSIFIKRACFALLEEINQKQETFFSSYQRSLNHVNGGPFEYLLLWKLGTLCEEGAGTEVDLQRAKQHFEEARDAPDYPSSFVLRCFPASKTAKDIQIMKKKAKYGDQEILQAVITSLQAEGKDTTKYKKRLFLLHGGIPWEECLFKASTEFDFTWLDEGDPLLPNEFYEKLNMYQHSVIQEQFEHIQKKIADKPLEEAKRILLAWHQTVATPYTEAHEKQGKRFQILPFKIGQCLSQHGLDEEAFTWYAQSSSHLYPPASAHANTAITLFQEGNTQHFLTAFINFTYAWIFEENEERKKEYKTQLTTLWNDPKRPQDFSIADLDDWFKDIAQQKTFIQTTSFKNSAIVLGKLDEQSGMTESQKYQEFLQRKEVWDVGQKKSFEELKTELRQQEESDNIPESNRWKETDSLQNFFCRLAEFEQQRQLPNQVKIVTYLFTAITLGYRPKGDDLQKTKLLLQFVLYL